MLISVLDSYGVEVLLRIYQSHLDAPGADAPVGPVPSAVVGQSNGEAISSVKSGRGGARSVGARACKPTTSPLTTDPTPQAHNGTRRRIAVGSMAPVPVLRPESGSPVASAAETAVGGGSTRPGPTRSRAAFAVRRVPPASPQRRCTQNRPTPRDLPQAPAAAAHPSTVRRPRPRGSVAFRT
jgi:hypothetical protein